LEVFVGWFERLLYAYEVALGLVPNDE
jgi:hypothetical protein